MWDTIFHVLQIIGYAGGAVAAIISGRLWLKEQKRQSVAKAKDDLIQTLKDGSEAWKSRYEVEHSEVMAYRADVHKKNDETNLRIIDLTNENADLKAKTDISKVFTILDGHTKFFSQAVEFFKEQTEINAKILKSFTELEERSRRPSPRKRNKSAGSK